MPVSIYQIIWIIIIYAFIGWCVEVAYAAMCLGKFVNRGFLNGPVCPIYGLGMLLIVVCLWGLRNNLLLLFLGSFILTTVLEFVTGFILERFFNEKWWDYSDMPFNIRGYICLKFSVLWGLAASFAVGAVHPFIYSLISILPVKLGMVFLSILSAVLITDFIITLVELLKLPKRLNAMLEIEKLLNGVSDGIGGTISDKTLALIEKNEEFKEEFAEKRTELERKKQEYIRLLEKRSFVHKRLTKAFPNLTAGRYRTVYERISGYRSAIQEKINEKKK